MVYESEAMYPKPFFTKRVQNFFDQNVKLIPSADKIGRYAIDFHDDHSVSAGRNEKKIPLNSEEILFTISYIFRRLKYPPVINASKRGLAIADGVLLLNTLLVREPSLSAICYYYLNEFDHYQGVQQSPYHELMLQSALSIPEEFKVNFKSALAEIVGLDSSDDEIFSISHILKQIRLSADKTGIGRKISELNNCAAKEIVPRLNHIINAGLYHETLAYQFLRYAFGGVKPEFAETNENLSLFADEVIKHLDLNALKTDNLILINVLLRIYAIFEYLFEHSNGGNKVLRATDFIQFMYSIKFGLISTLSELKAHFESTNLQHAFNKGISTRYHNARSHLLSYLNNELANMQIKVAVNIFISFLMHAQSENKTGFANHLLSTNIFLIQRLELESQKSVSSEVVSATTDVSQEGRLDSIKRRFLKWTSRAPIVEAPKAEEIHQRVFEL